MNGDDLITVELSASFFNCRLCFKPYHLPIFQCNAGHSLCSPCRKRFGKNCETCGKMTVYKHNKALEDTVTQAKFRCVNLKYGCTKLSSCHDKSMHERECPYLPLLCPQSGCTFKGSKDTLPGHLVVTHDMSVEKFHYDQTFRVFISDVNKVKPLLAEDGTTFLLQCCKEAHGSIVSVVCIQSPGLKEPQYLCDLKVRKNDSEGTQECDLVLRCHVPCTRLEDGMKNGKYFLLVPTDIFLSETYHLIGVDVCIKIQEDAMQSQSQPQRKRQLLFESSDNSEEELSDNSEEELSGNSEEEL